MFLWGYSIMSHYVQLFFLGFGVGIIPALMFLLHAFSFKVVTECVEYAAD